MFRNLKWHVAAGLPIVLAASLAAQSPTNTFVLDKSVEIPGGTLKAGSYQFSVIDSLSDRTVLQLNGDNGKKRYLLLGVTHGQLTGAPGQPVLWDAKTQGKHALRGFVMADGKSVELVYPKADAVALANKNHQSVVAVDTASEGRPELDKLSNRDMQMVNLWLLTPTRVGPDKGLEAKRFEVSGTTQVAQSGGVTPGNPVASATTRPAQSSTSERPVQVSRAEPPAHLRPEATTTGRRIERLPQTGSDLPTFYLISTTALFGAGMLHLRRRRFGVDVAGE